MTTVAAAGMAAVLVAVGIHAFWVEPTWLEVSRVELVTEKVDRPVRIVVLADLQTDELGSYQREVFRRVVEEQPDLILLAGDYFQAGRTQWETLRSELNGFLDELGLSAPSGIYAVRGNIDPDGWQRIFDGLPVTAVESRRSFELDDLRLTCLSVGESFDTELEVTHDRPERFHLVMGHSPNYALGQIDADLLVAGHTHGGQVRLPLVGPLVTLSRVPRSWAVGLTELPSGARLLVSRGIGMEGAAAPRLRFLCRPELVVIDLVPRQREPGTP
jgi:predicted MPP superfamily phosphohydrolase